MDHRNRPARISDVAKLAGVSTATVSYVLNNRGNISPETAERVRRAAEALHYRANAQGRFLVRGQSETIGVVVPPSVASTGTLPTFVMSGLIRACQRAGYHLIVLAPEPSQHDLVSYLEGVARSRRVDGMVLIYDADMEAAVRFLEDEQVPCVVYGGEPPYVWYNVDNRQGAWLATEHLLDLGHRRIVHLAGPGSCQTAQQRRQGYTEAMVARGLAPWITEGPMTQSSGYERTYELLTSPSRPSAIFAVNTAVSLGTLAFMCLVNCRLWVLGAKQGLLTRAF